MASCCSLLQHFGYCFTFLRWLNIELMKHFVFDFHQVKVNVVYFAVSSSTQWSCCLPVCKRFNAHLLSQFGLFSDFFLIHQFFLEGVSLPYQILELKFEVLFKFSWNNLDILDKFHLMFNAIDDLWNFLSWLNRCFDCILFIIFVSRQLKFELWRRNSLHVFVVVVPFKLLLIFFLQLLLRCYFLKNHIRWGWWIEMLEEALSDGRGIAPLLRCFICWPVSCCWPLNDATWSVVN